MLIEGGSVASWLSGKVLTAAFSEAVARVRKYRAELCQSILLQELEKGEVNLSDTADQDEAAAMVFAYAEAAMRGTARRNLRALAQILAGQLVTPPIYADEFLRWSNVLSDLTREELIIIARWHKAWAVPPKEDAIFESFQAELAELTAMGIVRNEDELTGVLQAVGRTGLIVHQAGRWGGAYFSPSPKLDDLMKIIRIEDILAEPAR